MISLGISPVDGRLHLDMDTHSDGIFYVKSEAGLVDNPAGLTWTASRFGAVQTTLDGLALTSQFTYPQFVATPEGRLQLSYRAGVSGNGRNALAEYDGTPGARSAGGRLHRHVHQRARHQHHPQHVPARHRLRRQRAAARLLHLARAELRGDVQRRRPRQPRHRLRLQRRPRPHLAQPAGTVVGTTGGSDKVSVTATAWWSTRSTRTTP